MVKEFSITFRFDSKTSFEIDKIIEYLERPGITVPASDAIRYAITMAAIHIEEEQRERKTAQ